MSKRCEKAVSGRPGRWWCNFHGTSELDGGCPDPMAAREKLAREAARDWLDTFWVGLSGNLTWPDRSEQVLASAFLAFLEKVEKR